MSGKIDLANWVVPRSFVPCLRTGAFLYLRRYRMKDKLMAMRDECLTAIEQSSSDQALEATRLKYLGKKGELTSILKSLGQLEPEERKEIGISDRGAIRFRR